MGRYKLVYMPSHPKADKNGFVKNRILVAESILGRPLDKDEFIWQKNLNPRDDSKENILIFRNKYECSAFFSEKRKERSFYECKMCGAKVFGKSKNIICRKCYDSINHSVKRPSKDVLESDLLILSIVSISKKYNVSDNAIRKWLKYYGLPFRKNDIKIWRKSFYE